MNWDPIVDKIIPHIVKIETQYGSGTGFLTLYNEDKILCGVATARHVVAQADEWQQPIRLRHHSSGETVFIENKKNERAIVFDEIDESNDSAVVIFHKRDFPLPEEPIPLFPNDTPISIGAEVGWLGFPNVAPDDLCFFSGNISARPKDTEAYLIDGVAIHGVSGGPVIYATETEGVQIVGTVSAYRANRATGEALPGLLIAQDVSYFHKVASRIRSIEEANKKKAALEASARKQVAASIQPTPPKDV